ncbi:MAG: phosphodiester glycosidase family protein, partial [Firmicutes bacterium]|nr:phosphodiester glycosidase family protein [Bacillota bacterium]
MFKGLLFFCAFVLSLAAFTQTTYGMDILFEHRTEYQPSRGVTFQRSRMMTENGMLDVHVIRVDLDEPYIQIAPVTSDAGIGRKETTSNLLRNAGAVAGINADFFGLVGAYSVHFGPLAWDGQLLGVSTYTNHRYNQFATFFMDMDNNPFFNYIRHDIRFYNNGRSNVEISTYNNIGHTLDWAIVVDRLAMYDTSELNRRFDNLIKIVVDGNSLIHISEPGETVQIPRHGYVVVLPERMAYRVERFRVGDITRLVRTNNMQIDYSGIQMAIGGGGLILSNGEVVNDRGIAPAGRHPRSAVGVSRDGRHLILMTVDGRTHSVGATHAEMAFLLRRYGAHDAMHFDGGGSTTLVTSSRGQNLTVANTVSDGSERRVVNALGVFNRAPKGEMVNLVLEMGVTRAITGFPVDGQIFGEDEFGNRVPVNMNDVTFVVEDESRGYWRNGRFTPLRTGRHTLEVQYGDFRAVQTIFAYALAELQPVRPSIFMFQGQTTPVRFIGVSTSGATMPVPAVERKRVYPTTLGHFVDYEFVATGFGNGYIAARIGESSVFFPITVAGSPRSIDMHSGRIAPLSAPAETVVNVSTVDSNNRRLVRLDYTFVPSDRTQAAYVSFNPPLEIPGDPVGLRLQVHGDGSGHWLRGRVQDAEGRNHIIDFSRNADVYGWLTVIANLPNAPGPFTIDQIYMVSLNSYETTYHRVFFYGLQAMYAPTNEVEIPRGSRFRDPIRAESGFTGVQGGNFYRFYLPTPGSEVRYSRSVEGEFAVVTITAYEGGIFAADSRQWGRFMRDIRGLDMEYVVILMDANPLNFDQRMEFELFHLALQELYEEGRTVFVVSATGAAGAGVVLTMRDGIRYID